VSRRPAGGELVAPAALITIGGIMVFSAFKGIGITEVLSGVAGDTLNPKGSAINTGGASGSGATDTSSDPTSTGVATGGNWTAPPGGAHSFKGSRASTLNDLAGIAEHSFHLRISATTNGTHVPDSYHYRGEAFDAAGNEHDMAGFAQYVQDHYGNTVSELIHNPGYAIKDGHVVSGPIAYRDVWEGHRDHVHVAMS
jgi:hypothetical protein